MTKEELLDRLEEALKYNDKLTKENWQLERGFNKCKNELDTYEEIFNELEKCIEGTWIGYCKEDCEWFEELQHKLLSILRSR